MNNKFTQLTIDLSDHLERVTMAFLISNLEEEENITDVLNIILSAHISSLFSLMRTACDDNPEREKVEEFIDKLMKYISTLNPITSVETIISHNINKTQ